MNNALLAIGGLLITILAALFGVPYLVDWNSYRGVFEEEATRVLGRDVRVGGGVVVRFLPVPFVRFERVRIADTLSETGDPFFKTDGFTMWLSITPLLRGVLEAREIELKRPVLRLVVDSQGEGNWSTLTMKPGALPFVPSDVSLQSVRITDGTIDIARKDGASLALLNGIDGELEADALDGPFRYRGNVRWDETPRELRFVTAKADADGALRIKASLRMPAGTNSYTLDGKLSGLKQRPRLDGQVAAKLALGPAAATDGGRKTAQSDRPGIEMKSAVIADGTGVKLSDLQLTFENVGQPQLASGQAQMAWVSRPAMEVKLTSRWLDLDRIGATGSDTGPLSTVRGLVSGLIELLPAEADSSVRLDVDQVNLGGDAVSGLKVVLGRSKGPLEVREFAAGLPGGAHVDFSGTVTDQKAHAFEGGLLLRGSSLTRFLAWSAKGQSFAEGRADGPFLVQGKLAVSEKGLDLTSATAETAGNTLGGELHIASGERRKVTLSVDGRKVDAVQLWPSELGNGRLEKLLTFGPAAPESVAVGDNGGMSRSAQSLLGGVKDTDIRLRLRAGELVAGARVLHDVDAELAVERGNLTLPLARFTTPDGASVELEGDVANVAEHPKGQVRWVATAASAPGLATLMQLSGIAARDAVDEARLAPFAPLRVAGVARFGARNEHSFDASLDGTAAGGRVRGSARLDAGRGDWRKAGAEFSATLDDTDLSGVLRLISPATAAAALDKAALPKRGQVLVKASGGGEKGLVTLASLAGEGLAVAYDGRVEAHAGGGASLDGRLRFTAKEARHMLALAGLSGGGRLASTAIEGVGSLTRSSEAIAFGADRLTIGGSIAKGTVKLTERKNKPTQLDVDLAVDQATVQGLAGGLTQPGAITSAPDVKSVWPEQPFDLSALEGVEGALKLKLGRLTMEPGLSVADATADIKVEPGRLTVNRLEAGALGGKIAARLTLAKAAAGVDLKGDLRLDGVKLDALATQGGRPLTGTATVSADFGGQALSAGALVAAIKGKGEIVLSAAQIGGFRAALVSGVAEAAIEGKGEREGEGLARALREASLLGMTTLGSRKVPVEIADGAARVGEIVTDSDEGRTVLVSTIDLAQLKLDAEWKLEPSIVKRVGGVPQSERIKLPPVSVGYVGDLKDLASLEPRWSAAGFERELTVRKMERDVEELERLRKLDEERAAAEKARLEAIEAEKRRLAEEAERARLQAIEAEKQRAAEAAAAASAAGQPVAPLPTDATAPPRGNGAQAVPQFGAPVVTPAEGAAPAPPPAETAPPPRPADSRRRTLRRESRG